jgi:hypothetical protein
LTVLILVVMCSVGLFFAVRAAVNSFVAKYTSPAPLVFPRVELTGAEREALEGKLASFRALTNAGATVPALELNPGELNALLARNAEFRDKFHLSVEGDQVKGQISLPLDKKNFPVIGRWLKGRYVNGSAGFRASVQGGGLVVNLVGVEVNGAAVGQEIMANLAAENLAAPFYSDMETSNVLSRLAAVEVRDGKVIVRPRVPSSP